MSMVAVRRGVGRGADRRGTTYAMVLALSTVVVIVGLSAVAVQRIGARALLRETDWQAAQLLAVSAAEHGLHRIQKVHDTDPSWRETLTSSEVFLYLPDGGVMHWALEGRDGGPPSADPRDAVFVVGTGIKGRARHTVRVAVREGGPAYSSLATALFAQDDVRLAPGTVVQSDAKIGGNRRVDLSGAAVYADTEASEDITGSPVVGQALPNSDPRGFPDDSMFDYYVERGEVINADTDLPGDSVVRYLENVLLSPEHNPFGPAQPDGIYVVDCRGSNLVIRNVRLLGTLVLENLADGDVVTVTGSINMAPAIANYPTLLVNSKLTLAASQDRLSESLVGVNFNPPGAPYRGKVDTVVDDEYPSIICGLVLSRRQLTLAPPYTTVEGTILAMGRFDSDPSSWLEITHRPLLAEDPPPGFYVPDGTLRVGAFSWEQVERPRIDPPALPEG